MASADDKPKPEAGDPQEASTGSMTVQICMIACVLVGIFVYQMMAPRIFAQDQGRFNFTRILAAAGVGAASALIGAGIGKLIDRLRGR